MNIVYKDFNERDVETPSIIGYVKERKDNINSALDVGAHYSAAFYARHLRDMLAGKLYDGVDFTLCDLTKPCLDNYFVDDFKNINSKYDLVMCISTLEHSGVYAPPLEDYVAEQKKVIKHIVELANKYIFMSFPFGMKGAFMPHYANITEDLLQFILDEAKEFNCTCTFWYNEFPQGKLYWSVVTREEAAQVPLRVDRGTQCICVLTGDKK